MEPGTLPTPILRGDGEKKLELLVKELGLFPSRVDDEARPVETGKELGEEIGKGRPRKPGNANPALAVPNPGGQMGNIFSLKASHNAISSLPQMG
jgi:hypothetical protein